MDKELYKCPYCDRYFNTYNGLCKHVVRMKSHGEKSSEDLLTDFKYDGVRPKCKCGCGEYTNISYVGGIHFCDYKIGHISRICNNWGHNKNAIHKSSITRKIQYKKGERIQWNKGRKWNETYDENTINKLKLVYKNEDRNKKISEKLKLLKNTDEWKEISRNIAKNLIVNKKFKIDSKLEEFFIENYLSLFDVEFIRQYYIPDIKQYCDFYIPQKKLIIECDGGFWHCDKRIFTNGPIYECQKNKIIKDKIKNDFLYKNGFELLRFWEYDIINNSDKVLNDLAEKLK